MHNCGQSLTPMLDHHAYKPQASSQVVNSNLMMGNVSPSSCGVHRVIAGHELTLYLRCETFVDDDALYCKKGVLHSGAIRLNGYL